MSLRLDKKDPFLYTKVLSKNWNFTLVKTLDRSSGQNSLVAQENSSLKTDEIPLRILSWTSSTNNDLSTNNYNYLINNSNDGYNPHKPRFYVLITFYGVLMKRSLRHWKMCLKQIISKVKAESDKQLAVYQNHLKSYISPIVHATVHDFFANVSDPTTKCDALISYKIPFLSFLSPNVWAVLTEPRIFEQSDLFEPQGHKNVFFGRTLNAHGDRKTTVTMIDH